MNSEAKLSIFSSIVHVKCVESESAEFAFALAKSPFTISSSISRFWAEIRRFADEPTLRHPSADRQIESIPPGSRVGIAARSSLAARNGRTNVEDFTTVAALDFLDGRLFIMQERGCVDYFATGRVVAAALVNTRCSTYRMAYSWSGGSYNPLYRRASPFSAFFFPFPFSFPWN